MTDAQGLIVSLPGAVVALLNPPGSLFEADFFDSQTLPSDLRAAIELVRLYAESRGRPLKFVARPEIFTHGPLLRWLNNNTQGSRDHIAISDGTTFRPLAGFDNHLFLYGLGRPEHAAALAYLAGVAPELIASANTQINTALRVKVGARVVRPPSWVIGAPLSLSRSEPLLHRLFVNASSPADSAAQMLDQSEASELPDLPVTVVPLTLAALDDERFMLHLAGLAQRCYFDEGRVLLLGLPMGSDEQTKERGLELVVARLLNTGIVFPRVLSERVFVASDQFAFPRISEMTLLLHHTAAFWRLGGDQLAHCSSIRAWAPRTDWRELSRVLEVWSGNIIRVERVPDRVR